MYSNEDETFHMTNFYVFSYYFRMQERVQKAVKRCVATEVSRLEEKNELRDASVNFIGVVLFNVKNATEK